MSFSSVTVGWITTASTAYRWSLPPVCSLPAHRYGGFLVDALHFTERLSTINRQVSYKKINKNLLCLRFVLASRGSAKDGYCSRVAMESIKTWFVLFLTTSPLSTLPFYAQGALGNIATQASVRTPEPKPVGWQSWAADWRVRISLLNVKKMKSAAGRENNSGGFIRPRHFALV